MTMMPLRSMPVVLSLLACVLLAGCTRKKPVLVMPQQPPPATAPTPAPTPAAEAQPPAVPQPSPTPAVETPSTTTGSENVAKVKSHPGTKKPSPQVPATGTTTARNNTKVIKNEDVPAPVPPPLTPEQQSQQAATEQLLQTTENAIKGITRQLPKEDQAILAQIKDFVSQSRDAMKGNDFVRARNLAQKAHLLSDELVKHK
jgi:hypothetical protein